MKLSACNQLPGTVVSTTPDALSGSVKVDIGGGTIVTSSLTGGAIADLAFTPGAAVIVLAKASDVLVGK